MVVQMGPVALQLADVVVGLAILGAASIRIVMETRSSARSSAKAREHELRAAATAASQAAVLWTTNHPPHRLVFVITVTLLALPIVVEVGPITLQLADVVISFALLGAAQRGRKNRG
jgi:Mn2+/Fe2+ NRAMP family transporter